MLAYARRDGYASQRGAGLKVHSHQELNNADRIRSLASLVRRFDGQAVALWQSSLDQAAKHRVLFALDNDKLPDLTSLQRIAGTTPPC